MKAAEARKMALEFNRSTDNPVMREIRDGIKLAASRGYYAFPYGKQINIDVRDTLIGDEYQIKPEGSGYMIMWSESTPVTLGLKD